MPIVGPVGRVSKRGLQTHEQILAAARRLFTERGYHQTSIYDLFEDAKITKGAFFHHWKTKEDLALSILEDLKVDFERHFFSIEEDSGRARHKLERLFWRVGDLSSSSSWSYGKLFAIWCAELQPNENHLGTALHQVQKRWYTMWRDLIRQAQAEQDLRGDISPENLTFLVVSSICGVQLMSRNPCGGSAKTACESLRKTILT
jgi:TetR/AcrR family transcriptional regulator, transcriptional repressor for nem operon